MFSKKDSKTTSNRPSGGPGPGPRTGAPSIIGGDMRITGDLLSEGEIQVDGTVDGDIKCDRLTIGEHASVTGEVVAEEVTVLGAVTGQIRSRAVILAKSSRVTGDVAHDTLAIESGAYIEGYCRRLNAAEEKERTTAKKATAEGGEGKLNLVVGAPGASGTAAGGMDGAPAPGEGSRSALPST